MSKALNKLILSSAAASEGEWIELAPGLQTTAVIAVYGFNAGDVAQLWVSVKTAKPAATPPATGDGTFKLGGDMSADTLNIMTETHRWLRVRKSAAGGSPATTKADFLGIVPDAQN